MIPACIIYGRHHTQITQLRVVGCIARVQKYIARCAQPASHLKFIAAAIIASCTHHDVIDGAAQNNRVGSGYRRIITNGNCVRKCVAYCCAIAQGDVAGAGQGAIASQVPD